VVETLLGRFLSETADRDWKEVYTVLVKTKQGGDPLRWVFITACKHGYSEIVELFLEHIDLGAYFRHETAHGLRVAALEGHPDTVRVLLDDPRVDPGYNDNSVIIAACSYCEDSTRTSHEDHALGIKILLAHPLVDPAARNNEAIGRASMYGCTVAVKLLLADSRVDPADSDNNAIIAASTHGHTGAVNLLLADPRVDPSARNDESIQRASRNGYAEVVKLLLLDNRVNPAADTNDALQFAVKNEHVSVIELLLADPRVNPADDNNSAIAWARYSGNHRVFNLLLAHPRIPLNMKNQNISSKLPVDFISAPIRELLKLVSRTIEPDDVEGATKQRVLLSKYFWWSRLEQYHNVPSSEIVAMHPMTDPLLLCMKYE